MIRLRRAAERGHAEHGWLHSHHTFSFSEYYDAAHMGHSVLRVINDDTVEPDKGFGTHPHSDMEIISYVLEGELAHKDSMGNGSTIRQGEVQRMSAGTGITHSEFNPSRTERMRFLQIWIVPDRQGYTPGYEQKAFPDNELRNCLRCVASPDGEGDSLTLHQDARMYLGKLQQGGATLDLKPGRCGYVQLAQGSMTLNDQAMQSGDGAYIDGAITLNLVSSKTAEVLVFDLPMRQKQTKIRKDH